VTRRHADYTSSDFHVAHYYTTAVQISRKRSGARLERLDKSSAGVIFKAWLAAEFHKGEWIAVYLLSAFSDYGEIGVVADLFGLPKVAAVVSGHMRQEGAEGHFGPLERPRSLGSGEVEAVGFLNELG
jgi:hypothetical protein